MSEHRRRRPADASTASYQDSAYTANPHQSYDEQPRYEQSRVQQQPHYEQRRYEQPHVQQQPRYEQRRYEQPHVQQQPRYEQPTQNMIVNQISINNHLSGETSYFDGGLLQWIGWSLLAGLLIFFTLGLGYPFAACMLYRWEAKHTVINGRRLRFDGTGMQLIGKWILWCLLTIITLGIYSFWLFIKLKQWRTKHTHFA